MPSAWNFVLRLSVLCTVLCYSPTSWDLGIDLLYVWRWQQWRCLANVLLQSLFLCEAKTAVHAGHGHNNPGISSTSLLRMHQAASLCTGGGYPGLSSMCMLRKHPNPGISSMSMLGTDQSTKTELLEFLPCWESTQSWSMSLLRRHNSPGVTGMSVLKKRKQNLCVNAKIPGFSTVDVLLQQRRPLSAIPILGRCQDNTRL